MKNLGFDFDPYDPSAFTVAPSGYPHARETLPYAPKSHTSYKAAQDAAPGQARKKDRLRELYRTHGALSDPEVEVLMNWPRSTVCSVRNSIKHELIRDGVKLSPYGKECDRYRLPE